MVTSSIWSGTYSIAAGLNGAAFDYFYSQTQGSFGDVTLDELAFSFAGSNNLGTLTSISISPSGAAGTGVSRLALDAITITTAPEPSTIFLFATGIGMFGIARRKKSTV